MIDFKDNSINFVRLFSAFQVMSFHTITHMNISIPYVTKLLSFFPGVPIFLCISGYLIASSLEESYSPKQFFKKRIMRIYPELWLAVAVSSICILLLYKETINICKFILFNFTQATIMQFWTPGFLRDYGVGTPNGSLWAISMIVQFYILIYFIYKYIRNIDIKTWLGILLFFILINVFSVNLDLVFPEVIFKLYTQTLIPYLYMFLIGTFMYVFKDVIIPILIRNFYSILILTVVFSQLNLGIKGIYISPASGLMLCLLSISFAYKYKNIKIKRDLSYGIYLYHMIIVNLFVQIGYKEDVLTLFLVIILSVICAYLSGIISKKGITEFSKRIDLNNE